MSAVGIVALVVGAITAPLPVPIGLPLIALGVALLITSSKTAIRLVRRIRARYPRLDEKILLLQGHLPGRLGRAMRRTDGARHREVQARVRRRRDTS